MEWRGWKELVNNKQHTVESTYSQQQQQQNKNWLSKLSQVLV
jgi:hypothetical protein